MSSISHLLATAAACYYPVPPGVLWKPGKTRDKLGEMVSKANGGIMVSGGSGDVWYADPFTHITLISGL